VFRLFRSNFKTIFSIFRKIKKGICVSTLVKKVPYCGRRVGGVRRGWLASLFAVNRPEEEEAIIREQDLVGAGILLGCRHQLAVLHRSWLKGQS
jgi:hypothetical protein